MNRKEYIRKKENELDKMPNCLALLTCILHSKSISKALSDQRVLTRVVDAKEEK